MIFQKKPQRGATPRREMPSISHHHVIAVAFLSAAVALGAIVTPSGEVNAKRQVEDRALTIENTPEPAAALPSAAGAGRGGRGRGRRHRGRPDRS
jgi:hypothetical protein